MNDPETFIPPCLTEQRRIKLGAQGAFELWVDCIGDHIYNTIVWNEKERIGVEIPSNQSLKEMQRILDQQRVVVAAKEEFEDAAFYRDIVNKINEERVWP